MGADLVNQLLSSTDAKIGRNSSLDDAGVANEGYVAGGVVTSGGGSTVAEPELVCGELNHDDGSGAGGATSNDGCPGP